MPRAKRVVPILRSAIAQKDLEQILAIEAQQRSLKKMHAEKCSEILTRLLEGCVVEPGRHFAGTQDENRGSRRVTRLLIDGELR